MEQSEFNCVKAQVPAATGQQILELEDAIQLFTSRQFTEMELARRTRQTVRTRTCPHCQSNDILLHGKDQNRRQRFKCRDCRRTYNILTGTTMARARKPEKWCQYLGYMTEHTPLREIVASGIGVHLVTAWRWRHRFLTAAANENASRLSGVIEADTTFFRRSFKGSRGGQKCKPRGNRPDRPLRWRAATRGASHEQVPVLTALDSSGGVFEAILASLTEIETTLQGRISAGSVLCSDGNTAYINVADKATAEHRTVMHPTTTRLTARINPVPTPARKPGHLGLGRVNNHHQRLKYLINERCRGVATKYLVNYLGWHRAMIRSGFEGKMLLALALG